MFTVRDVIRNSGDRIKAVKTPSKKYVEFCRFNQYELTNQIY